MQIVRQINAKHRIFLGVPSADYPDEGTLSSDSFRFFQEVYEYHSTSMVQEYGCHLLSTGNFDVYGHHSSFASHFVEYSLILAKSQMIRERDDEKT